MALFKSLPLFQILVLVAGEVSETPLEKTFVNFPDAWANFQQMEEIHREESLFARHRRQAPPPMNDDDDIYIYPKDSDEDSGPWGEWEAEGSCSRTCGGGVFRETRPCNASPGSGRDACKGPDKRFKSCNLEPCYPGSRDFREEQCSEFDRIPFERKMYSWIPYLKAPRKCELNCMPRGERFYYRHAKKVIDGTLCHEGDGIRRVCVDGDCREIGCDGVLGSDKREDKCRVCGGDGSGCNTVTGLLDDQELTMGYHDLILIPAGATNILIKEVETSNNYLALRNTTGHYFLNGNWKIDFPGSYDAAGTMFHYEKKHKSGKSKGLFAIFAPEFLRALGPTNEPIYLTILSQEKNPGISFEYSIPTGAIKETSPDDSYEWMPLEWGECDSPCGGGQQSRELSCVHSKTKEVVPNYLCDISLQPDTTQACNESPCKPMWKVGQWSNCTDVADGGDDFSGSGDDEENEEGEDENEEEGSCSSALSQVQVRNVYCHQILATGNPSIVNDSVCQEATDEEKPVSVKLCNIDLESEKEGPTEGPQYHIAPWSSCDKLCGKDGKMTRMITCHEVKEEETLLLDESSCSNSKKPVTEKECEEELPLCSPLDWVSTTWSECPQESCEESAKVKTRISRCTDKEGNIHDSELCNTEMEPTPREPCNATNIDDEVADCGPIWLALQWSDCSSKCKDVKGVRTRDIFCAYLGDNGTFVPNDDDSECNSEKKYDDTEECTGLDECKGQWFASEWGPCSSDCEAGQKTRTVFCLSEEGQTDPGDCNADAIPESEDSCNEDVECSGDEEEEEEECEYYEDKWIWGGESGSGEEESEAPEEDSELEESDESGSGSEGSGSYDLTQEDLMNLFSKRCKPESQPPCDETEYGCCPDNFNAAKGPFHDGCNPYETCEDTRYGCCRDWITPANGTDFKDCPPSDCDEHLFGCCPDGETTALGPDDEGCEEKVSCSTGKYGCCPNDFTFAQGPKNKGCFECPPGIWECDICEKTEFGCCTDLQTAASGPNFQGCEEGSGGPMLDCSDTEFGCCPDGLARAKGVNFKGCKNATPCKDSRWGCCDDLVNPAHGPSKEGCCLNSEFGCCRDNIMPAKGLELEGCGCEFTKYKCCPDDVTSATGTNFEGCGCQSTEFGCCPDNYTPAKGENYAGCPCYSYEFGCCPDGISIARGPGQEGCSCKDTEFGCCPDRKTPANGTNGQSCGCAASEFGCCPDGIEDSKGKNFEECDSLLPIPTPDVCGLPKNRGEGKNFTTKWFFDMEYGGCAKFFYGGKGGNQNNFIDQETCEKVCVNPVGRAACVLPKVPGPCEGYYPRYAYDTETKACDQFNYGGCLGNNNKFESLEECEGTCSEDPEGIRDKSMDKCEQPIEPGPCQGNVTRWGYNEENEECEEFNYGGCKGNDNSFMTKDECSNSCKPQGYNRQMCLLPRDPGPCKDRHPKWNFDNFEKRCVPFYYGGCEGNDNRFDDLESCQMSCPKEFLQSDVCKLPQVQGPCGDYLERYYFDILEGVCKPFHYGGCDGNKNNFKSMADCQSRCSVDFSIPITPDFKLEYCFLSKDEGIEDENNPKMQKRWYYDSTDGVCKKMNFKGRRGNGNRFLTRQECETSCRESQNICSLPKVRGPCNSQIESYWYDEDKNSCFQFTWGGCEGNGNRFESLEFCEAKCKDTGSGSPGKENTKVDICNLPVDTGPCTERVPSWHFNSKNEKCSAFIYSGCEGNANRFQTQEQCDRQCGQFKGQNVCGSPMDIGPCVGRFKKWYYDIRSRSCKEFTFGGCEGNGNRFSSIEECETICLLQDEIPIPGNNTQESKNEICSLDMDVGPCDDQQKRWYFSTQRQTCVPFLYSGCAGNRNRFKSYEICMGFCGIEVPQPEEVYPPIEDNPRPPQYTRQPTRAPYPSRPEYSEPSREENPQYPSTAEPSRVNQVPEYDPSRCLEFDRRCSQTYCQFGLLRYRDDRSGCELCYCNEPCQGYNCPENSRCVEELYRVREGSEETEFRPVCRPMVKEGACPKLSNNAFSPCERECSGDSSCGGSQKCCFNGCGESCIDPVFDPGMNIVPTERPAPPPAVVPEENDNNNLPTDAARIHVPMPTVIANEGDIAVLQVHADGNPHPDVYWRLGRRDIDTQLGKHKVYRDGTLQIIGVDPSDEGVYTCLADNGRGVPAEATVTLAVDSPINLDAGIVPTETDITLSLGSPATLECLAFGYPKPTVTWWKNREMIPMDTEQYSLKLDHSLHIRSLNLQDLGEYTCQVYNGIGNGDSHNIIVRAMGPVYGTNKEDEPYLPYLVDGSPEAPTRDPWTQEPPRPSTPEVKRPPWAGTPPTRPPTYPPSTTRSPTRRPPDSSRIDVRIMPTNTEHTVGQYIQIECIVNSYTQPYVYWYKNGDIITPDDNIQISGVNNTLIIYESQATDGGTYTCQADNGVSTQRDSISINIVNERRDPGYTLNTDCTDNPYFVNCKLIVRANYCGNKYYAKFCCRSCRQAGQL